MIILHIKKEMNKGGDLTVRSKMINWVFCTDEKDCLLLSDNINDGLSFSHWLRFNIKSKRNQYLGKSKVPLDIC